MAAVSAADIKFLGTVQSYNQAKKFGMVACEEASRMWGQDIYAYKDVLAAASATVGDTIRFGIHVNPRGQPQVSLPVFKVGEDGVPIGVPAGTEFVNAEELIAEDPGFLERIKEEINSSSDRQNRKRTNKGGGQGGGQSGNPRGGPRQRTQMEAWGPPEAWGGGPPPEVWGGGPPEAWGPMPPYGEFGGPPGLPFGDFGGWGGQEVSLFVSGVPRGVTRRELLHIFRQYAGFVSLRQIEREDHTLVFVSFASIAQAQFVAEALTGYVFDEEAPPDQQTVLSLAPAKQKTRN